MTIDRDEKRKFIRSRPTIGVLTGWQVYAGVMDSFLSHVFQGIIAGAQRLEYNLMIACGAGLPYQIDFGRPAWPFHSPNVDYLPVGPENCDGLILISPPGSKEQREYIDRLLKQKYPVIITGEYPGGSGVTVDNRGGIYQAVSHLVAHGHRRIAYISGRADETGDAPARSQAYLESLKLHNIEFDPSLVANGYHTVAGGRLAMETLLARKAEFTAVIGSNDLSTIGAMQVIQSAGMDIPHDVALIGFDDRIDARAQIPMLSTIHFPMYDLGYQAVRLLSQYIEETLTGQVNICIPTRLVLRESCGCTPRDSLESLSDPLAQPKPQKKTSRRAASEPATVTSREIYPAILEAIVAEVNSESYRLGSQEVEHLCLRLAEAFLASIKSGNPQPFAATFQQILAHASSQKDDLLSWHKVVSIFRRWLPALYDAAPRGMNRERAEEMLNQALFSITEVSQGQNAQWTVRQEQIANLIGSMSTAIFSAQSSAAVYDELLKHLPGMGIAHAAVAFYKPDEDNPAAWIELQASPRGVESHIRRQRFQTCLFPDETLFPLNAPLSLALLPISVPGVGNGFVALDTGNLQLCATIVQQLSAALRGIHLYREAVEARLAAEDAYRVKNRFLSWVIHELRTPLNLIYGLSDLLAREESQPGTDQVLVDREDINRIHLGAEHLINLIRDVLDLALSELGQLKLAREPLDLRAELEETALVGKQLALEKGLAWRVCLDNPLPLVQADKTRLRQVLLNLIHNAVKFTASGEVSLNASASGGQVKITISDTGLGIPQDEQELIFEEFQQSGRTTKRGFGGLGLGLAICKRLVEMHGGEIGVYSTGEEGKGSTFYIQLPAVENPDLPQRPAGQAQKILLLVNDLDHGRNLKMRLVEEGYQVEIFLVQEDCDWRPRVLVDPPHAIVLDLGLASDWGWDILRTIKEDPTTQNVPVLFCSLEENDEIGTLLDIEYMTRPAGSGGLAALPAQQESASDLFTERKRILIVDDEPDTLNLHARVVQAQFPTCQVFLAGSGREALEMARSKRPDLMLLDLLMPEVDGFSVLKSMQQDEALRGIPVVIITGQSLTAEDVRRMNGGVVSVLNKGLFSEGETMAHLADAVARRRKGGSETQRVVLKAITYLQKNYAAQITRQDVAEFVGLSERHLTRCFNLELGVTPMAYLNRYRIMQARILLEAGGSNITEIAEKVGFSSGGYFTRVFRDEVGVSPREYQQGGRVENLSQKGKNSSLI